MINPSVSRQETADVSAQMIANSMAGDPFEPDEAADRIVMTTDRRLARLAVFACDTGARFACDSEDLNPAAWMMTPKPIFEGARPIDACQELVPFIRGTILHGLRLGLDATPDDVLAMTSSNASAVASSRPPKAPPKRKRQPRFRLYSASLEGSETVGRYVQAFCAIVAPNEPVVRERLARRYGRSLAAAADVRRGFDGTELLANVLLSNPVHQMMSELASDVHHGASDTSDIYVEQRFVSGQRRH